MKLDLRDLDDDQFVERLLEAGRSEAPSEQAVADTLRAIGAGAAATTSLWPLVWKLLAGVGVTATIGLTAWAVLPRETPRAATHPKQSAAQTSTSVKVMEPEAEPPRQQEAEPAPSATAPRRTATSVASPGKDKADRLLAEVRALDEVRAAIRQGQPSRALGLLDGFERKFPAPVLGNEARVLRIEALAKSGSEAEARRLGDQYLRETPDGPLSNRVRAITSGRQESSP